MDSKNPNLDTTHNNHTIVLSSTSSSSQDFKKTNLQHNGLNKFHEDNQGFIFNNAYNEVMIKKPTFVSSSSLVAGEGHIKPSSPPPPSRQDFKKTHQEDKIHVSEKMDGNKGLNFENPNCEIIKKPNYDHVLSCYSPAAGEGNMTIPPPVPPPEVAGLVAVPVEGESGRERLNRHRVEMAGRVRIPDIWGHEDLLKDWIDCTVFDSSLGNKTIMSARAALVQEGRSTRRIENQYC